MNSQGNVRGEALVANGDASRGEDLKFFSAEGPCRIGPNDRLSITDVMISQKAGSTYELIEGKGGTGRRIAVGTGTVHLSFALPYECATGCSLTYVGSDSGLNVCMVHGFVT